MHVLLLTSTFPLHAGDVRPRFVADLANALAERPGMRVSVLAPHAQGALRFERIGKVEVHRFRYFWPSARQQLAYGHGMSDNLRSKPLTWLQVLPYVALQSRALRRLCASHDVDVVNSHWALPQGVTTTIVRRKQRFAHVLTVHGSDAFLLRRLPFGRAIARRVVGRSDCLLPVGRHLEEVLEELVGELPPTRIQPMGVDLELFGGAEPLDAPPFNNQFLLYVGRLLPIKGVDRLLRVMPKVLERAPDAGLVVIGYGQSEPELRELRARLGLEKQVLFLGPKSHAEVARYLKSCTALVVPSVRNQQGVTEGTPTVVLEALAAGAPVVASKVGGIPGVVEHGRSGWLVEPDDSAGLASALCSSFTADREEMRAAALRAASLHSWPKVAEHYAQAFAMASGQPSEEAE